MASRILAKSDGDNRLILIEERVLTRDALEACLHWRRARNFGKEFAIESSGLLSRALPASSRCSREKPAIARRKSSALSPPPLTARVAGWH